MLRVVVRSLMFRVEIPSLTLRVVIGRSVSLSSEVHADSHVISPVHANPAINSLSTIKTEIASSPTKTANASVARMHNDLMTTWLRSE